MYYKNFEEHITRKHGIVIEGWPLRAFDNPSAIGSQVELKVLLNSWQAGATRFRKMSNAEHLAWVENRPESGPPPPTADHTEATLLQQPPQHRNPDSTPTTTNTLAPEQSLNTIDFGSPSTVGSIANPTVHVSNRARKTRSDKGQPRKKRSQIPGAGVFQTM